MVLHKEEHAALVGVREAIIANAAEDASMIGEMSEWTEAIIEAWNKFADSGVHAQRIEPEDIDKEFE